MGEVVNFPKKKRPTLPIETFEQMAARIFDGLTIPNAMDALYVDTAPSEYVAPDKDPA